MQSQDKSEKNNLLRVIFFIAFLNLIIYLITQAFFAYGLFRDELYYLACANRIQLGYVDHPPLSIYLLAVYVYNKNRKSCKPDKTNSSILFKIFFEKVKNNSRQPD